MPSSPTNRPPPRPPACVALVDSRFLHWLQGSDDEEDDPDLPPPEPSAPEREQLASGLADALHRTGRPVQMLRTYWYTSVVEAAAATGQVVRVVPPESEDGGAGLVLAMARDAMDLARHNACAHLLLASDDDRLLATVDQLQLMGMQVHVLADRAATDLASLWHKNPSWASLLKQADSRPEIDGTDKAPRHRGPASAWASAQASRAQLVDLEAIPGLVTRWITSLDNATRDQFRAELPGQRGLPQEADRALLVEISQSLGRPLAVPERKLMRELARHALGEASPEPA